MSRISETSTRFSGKYARAVVHSCRMPVHPCMSDVMAISSRYVYEPCGARLGSEESPSSQRPQTSQCSVSFLIAGFNYTLSVSIIAHKITMGVDLGTKVVNERKMGKRRVTYWGTALSVFLPRTIRLCSSLIFIAEMLRAYLPPRTQRTAS